jgi:hypothetical protein
MAEANTRPEIIAAKLNRSVHAIKARAYTIGLPLKWFKLKAKGEGEMSNRNRKWSPEDDQRLLDLKEAGAPLAVIAEELKRTQSAIDGRTNALKNRADPALRRPHDEGA